MLSIIVVPSNIGTFFNSLAIKVALMMVVMVVVFFILSGAIRLLFYTFHHSEKLSRTLFFRIWNKRKLRTDETFPQNTYELSGTIEDLDIDLEDEHVASVSTRSDVRSDNIILKIPIDELSPYEFEHLLAMYFRDYGFVVEEVGGAGDGGVDLVMIDNEGLRTAVQVKHWKFDNVGPSVIREIYAARLNHKCHYAMVITSSGISEAAMKEAKARGVICWNGDVVNHTLSLWPFWKVKPKNKRKPRKK